MDIFQKLVLTNLGISISDDQLEKFILFEELLIKWNNQYNLTSIIDPEEIRIKHFYDSLTCLTCIPINENFSLIDVGTGAGFPGIPLTIINPNIQLTLVESIRKKADFCRIIISELGIKNSRVITSRAETIGQDLTHREQYDWAVARAVAPLPILVEYLLPLVHIGGSVLAQKGFALDSEINKSKKAILILGGSIKKKTPISLPENMGKRTLIHIKKNKTLLQPTPAGLVLRRRIQ